MKKCALAIKGAKNSFSDLRQQYGSDKIALAKYIAENKGSIPKLSEVEKADRVDDIVFSAVKFLTANGNLSVLDLGKEDFSDDRITSALLSGLNSFISIALSSTSNAANGVGKRSEQKYRAQKSMAAINEFGELVERARTRLYSFSLSTDTRNLDVEELFNEEDTENNSPDRIYSMSAEERNRLDSISTQVKVFLATMREKRYNDEGDVVEVLNDLGMPKLANFQETYSTVAKVLAGVQTYEEMVDKLRDLANDVNIGLPSLIDLVNALETQDAVNRPGNVTRMGDRVFKNFENAFFTNFRNSVRSYRTLLFGQKSDMDGNKKSYVEMVNTNKRRADNALFNKWAQNNIAIGIQTRQKDKVEYWNKIKGRVMPKNPATRKEKMDAINDPNDVTLLAELQEMLSAVGIEVQLKALKNARAVINRGHKNSKKFGSWVYSVGEGNKSKSLVNILESFWLGGANIFETDRKALRVLAKMEAALMTDFSNGAFLNSKKNMIYPLNMPTGALEMAEEFLSNPDGRLQDFLSDPMMSSFLTLDAFESGNVEMAYFEAITNNDAGSAYDELDPVSSMAARLGIFLNKGSRGRTHDQSNSMGWLMVPTPADRTGSRIIKVPKLQNVTILGNSVMRNTDLGDWLVSAAKGEWNRIQAVREEFAEEDDKSKLIINYHVNKEGKLGNGGFFNYFTELNQLIKTDENGNLQEIDMDSPEVYKLLSNAFMTQYKAELDYMKQVGFISGHGGYTNTVLSKQASKILPAEGGHINTIQSFIANSIVYNHELSTIFNGDLAYFGNVDFASVSGEKYNEVEMAKRQAKQFATANKRAGLSDTPGTKLRIGSGGANEYYRTAFLEDVITSLPKEQIEQYKKYIKSKAKAYESIEATDGQGFVSLDRYAEILGAQGLLTNPIAETIRELKKETDPSKINWDKVREVLQPIKGFHQGQRKGKFGKIQAINLKYSTVPIIPAVVSGNPTMSKLWARMQEGKIDEAVFLTGSKFGAYNINSMSDTGKLRHVKMSNRDWRMPQIVPYKEKTKDNMGTQLRKLIVANVNRALNYGSKTGEQMLNDYQMAISLNLQQDFTSYARSVFTDGKASVPKMAKKVLDSLKNNSFMSVPASVERSLEVTGDETNVPMSFPSIKTLVEKTINSSLRKKVTKQELPGFSAVQFTSIGYNKSEIRVSETLEFVKIKNGKVQPAEIMVSPQYFIGMLRKGQMTPDKVKAIAELEAGTFDLTSIPESLLEGVIFRIPTQGKNSALPVKVKKLLPRAQGASIILPAAITTQSGSDYDIDKVWLEVKSFKSTPESLFVEDEHDMNTREGRDNIIVQTHYDVLTSEEHFAELITPNNSDTLDRLAKEAAEIFKADTYGRKWSSIATQDDFREKNQAGGSFIGVSSDANTLHAVFQEIGLLVKGDIMVGGRSVRKLGGKYVGEKEGSVFNTGRLISDDHIEIQTAAVDNANNPILGRLNINMVTGNAFLFLVESGAGLDYASMIVGSPIVRELTKRIRQNEALLGREAAYTTALKELMKDRKWSANDVHGEGDITIEKLNAALDEFKSGKFNTGHDLETLNAYLKFRKLGGELRSLMSAMKMDTRGAQNSLAANLIQADNLTKVKGTYSNAMYNKEHGSNPDGTIETFSFDRVKYQDHSMENYEKFGLHGAIQVAEQFIEDGSPLFKQAIKMLQSSLGGFVSEKDIRIMSSDLYSYVLLNREAYDKDGANKHSILAKVLDNNVLASLMYGDNSLGKRILAAQNQERQNKKEDVSYQENRLLALLSVDLDVGETGKDLVSFNNTINRAIDSDMKTLLMQELDRLWEDPETQELAIDMVLYSLGTEGFNRGPNSYSEFISPEIFKAITDSETGESVIDYFKDVAKDFNDPENFFTGAFIEKFVINRATQLTGIKNLTRLHGKNLETWLMSNPQVKIALGKDKGKLKIIHSVAADIMELPKSERNATPVYTFVADVNENPGHLAPYLSGESIINAESAADALTREQQADNVTEEEDSTCELPPM